MAASLYLTGRLVPCRFNRPSPRRHRDDDKPGHGTRTIHRAIKRGDLLAAEMAAREMGSL
jgi:hypothetical protein